MNSKLFTINIKDLLNGLLIAFLTAFLTGVVELLQSGTLFTWPNLKVVLIAAVCAALSYLIKSFATNSKDQLLTSEPPG